MVAAASRRSAQVAATRKIKTEYEQTLFYLDGPQVVALSAGPKSKIIAVATDNIDVHGFFGAKVSIRQFGEYLNERFDLRYLMYNADRQEWYKLDLPQTADASVLLTEVTLTKQVVENLMPDHGFFARNHTEQYLDLDLEVGATQRFNVDGNWDMREFSKFHSHVSDLYALTRSIDIFVDENASIDKKREIMDSFVKPWEGGGSYYGFFRSMAKTGGRASRPDIKAIQWASPGYIDIVGDNHSFAKLIALLRRFSENKVKVLLEYDHLWSYLHETKYLNRSSRRLDKTSDIAKEVGARAQSLSKVLGITPYRNLKKMAGNDPVVAAKVLLATKRRVERLFIFFAEGRVAIQNETIS